MNDKGTFFNKKYYIMFVELELHNFGNLPVRIVLIEVLLIMNPLYKCITILYKVLILDLNNMYHLPV